MTSSPGAMIEYLYRTGFRLTNPVEARIAHWLRGLRHAGVPRGDLKGHLVAAINLYLDWLDGRIQIANTESYPFPISRPESANGNRRDDHGAAVPASPTSSPPDAPDVSSQGSPDASPPGQSGDTPAPVSPSPGSPGSVGTDSSFGTLAKYVDDF